MNDTVARPAPRWRRKLKLGFLVLLTLLLAGAVAFVVEEVQSSRVQARQLHRYGAGLTYAVQPGASDAIRFPEEGPFDERLGYAHVPQFVKRLSARDFELQAQARFSPALLSLAERGYFPPYREKTQAGLDILDCAGEPLFRTRYPYRIYGSFEAIPPVVVKSLLFIENRDLLDGEHPYRNPAVDWVRLGRAVASQFVKLVDADAGGPGGSTLATQIEKFRHSPDGVTGSIGEKLRQMVSASLRAYRDGEDTRATRRRIVLDYLNTVPLSAAPGYGEVNGLSDGLWVWFGADVDRTNKLLAEPAAGGARLAEQGQALRQVLALMIAHRRPSYYLAQGRDDLAAAIDSHLRLLAQAGIIGAPLRDAATAQKLVFRNPISNPAIMPAAAAKGTMALRARLAGMLEVPLYSLDRLDATVSSSLNRELQDAVTDYLRQLEKPDFARKAGLYGERLLGAGDPGAVRYSFTLFERMPDGNRVRVQTDTTEQLLDINEGSKLELGSTAKLRTLATYLEIIAELHRRYADQPKAVLRQAELDAHDVLSRWAVEYIANREEPPTLAEMLDAAMERRYSASPGESFFTGGGLHTFSNFKREDNGRIPSVREALRESINLPFIRMMRDIVRYTMAQGEDSAADILHARDNPRRAEYLARFADREGRVFMHRFWRKYHGQSPEVLVDTFLDGLRPTPERLAAVYRYIEPQADQGAFAAFLRARLPEKEFGEARITALYERYAPGKFDLPDQGYIARVHPLELWLVAYLRHHPQASFEEAARASERERQQVYGWLFKSRAKGAQDSRIYTMLEVEAFSDIHRRWKRLGYPFDHLVPSLATALGSSGDRPAALSELMGIIVNDGTRMPTARIESLRFAADTPYETALARKVSGGERAMAPEVAAALRAGLAQVVEAGTARRLSGAFALSDGSKLSVGGKTGTGDNRMEAYGTRGQVLGSRALNRTATFVFYIGARHFGTLTAYVAGKSADDYVFTSALPVQILKGMAPVITPHLDPTRTAACGRPPQAVVAQSPVARNN